MATPLALSWSEIALWEEDPAAWERSYILGIKEKPSSAMRRGTYIHSLLGGVPRDKESENYTLDEIRAHTVILENFRMSVMGSIKFENKIEIEINNVPTKGFWDGWIKETNTILEIKTGSRLWDENKAKDLGQLTFYSLQAISTGISIPKCILFSASTKNGKCVMFQFQKELADLENMRSRIVAFKHSMDQLMLWDKRIGSKDRLEV